MNSKTVSRFETSFGMLHSLDKFKSECERIVNDARQTVSTVADGLENGELPSDRAVQSLRDVDANLSRLAR
jgi:hypothetical protein